MRVGISLTLSLSAFAKATADSLATLARRS